MSLHFKLQYDWLCDWAGHTPDTKQTKTSFFSPCYLQPQRQPAFHSTVMCAVQLKMPVRLKFRRWKFYTSPSPPFISGTRLLSLLSVFLTKQGHDIQAYANFLAAQASTLNFWMLLPSLDTLKTAQLHLRDKTSLCQCEGNRYPDIHAATSGELLPAKVVFWQMLRRLSRRGVPTVFFVLFF